VYDDEYTTKTEKGGKITESWLTQVQRTIQMQNARFEQNANVLPIIIKTIELL
jgi:hypothetical protein